MIQCTLIDHRFVLHRFIAFPPVLISHCIALHTHIQTHSLLLTLRVFVCTREALGVEGSFCLCHRRVVIAVDNAIWVVLLCVCATLLSQFCHQI